VSVLEKLASVRGLRGDAANKQLARELAALRDEEAIRELAENLHNRNRRIRSDCIKVLYEIGELDPWLIGDYAELFLDLLDHRNNRLVWGAMSALAAVAEIRAEELFARRREITAAVLRGSVITVDRGIRALATVAAQDDEYRRELFPYLLDHLRACRPKDLPGRAEGVLVAVDEAHRDAFISVLEQRMPDMRPSQAKRLKKVIAKAGER